MKRDMVPGIGGELLWFFDSETVPMALSNKEALDLAQTYANFLWRYEYRYSFRCQGQQSP